MKFDDLKLSDPILRSLKDQNYKEPTPIQVEVIPAILNKSDIMAAAQTGTGKTAAFVLPTLSILSNPKNNYKGHQLRALILTPTRELAAQVRESVNIYSKYLSIRSTAVYGGARIHNQKLKLKKGVDVLVATPGRLLDLYNQKAVNFKNIEATKRTEIISGNAQWFEDHSPIDPRFRKNKVKGVSAKVINLPL